MATKHEFHNDVVDMLGNAGFDELDTDQFLGGPEGYGVGVAVGQAGDPFRRANEVRIDVYSSDAEVDYSVTFDLDNHIPLTVLRRMIEAIVAYEAEVRFHEPVRFDGSGNRVGSPS